MSRFFNRGQRTELFLRAEGRCMFCGVDLRVGWHADHIQPFSGGGRTDLSNGQALCRACNLMKGVFDVGHATEEQGTSSQPADEELIIAGNRMRRWQKIALRKYSEIDGKDMLVVGTPGAGKTKFAAALAHRGLEAGRWDRVVVVCHTEHLKRQWEKAMNDFGIDLDPYLRNDSGAEASDYHGCAITYQQLAAQPMVHQLLCRRSKTLVIFDEVHHAGEKKAWGDALLIAFDEAVFRLALSGTPFRSDNNPIPFVRYVDGRSQADYTYGYGPALADGVCRSVLFPHFEGPISWMSGFDVVTHEFRDILSTKLANERLRMALHPDGDMFKNMLADAHKQLMELRETDHPNAGGLLITTGAEEARYIAQTILPAVTQKNGVKGPPGVLVISEEPEATKRIQQFTKSAAPWMVAVRMVSEGVDIPRLRVGVYATNVTTELHVRQFMGRIARMIHAKDANGRLIMVDGRPVPEPEEQSAFFFMPADDRLKDIAQQIKEERDHQLEEELEMIRCEMKRKRNDFQMAFLIKSHGEHDGTILDQQEFPKTELDWADRVKSGAGLEMYPNAQVALLLRQDRRMRGEPEPTPNGNGASASGDETVTMHEQKRALKQIVSRKVAQLAIISEVEHKIINWKLNEECGGPKDRATVEQLEKRIKLLEEWIGLAECGGWSPD